MVPWRQAPIKKRDRQQLFYGVHSACAGGYMAGRLAFVGPCLQHDNSGYLQYPPVRSPGRAPELCVTIRARLGTARTQPQ